MKKIISLFIVVTMIFLFVGCKDNSLTNTQISQNADLTNEKLAEIVAQELGVPQNADITYEVSEKFFWEASEDYYKNVTYYEDGEVVASASVNPQNGELLRNIFKYSE